MPGAGDLNGSPAVAGEPSPTVRPINDDEQQSSGEWSFVTLAGPKNEQYFINGAPLPVQDLTRETMHADAAPAAVEKAVNAAGGASVVAEPTNIEATPPSTADAGNAAGANSTVVEKAPAATVVNDANSAASVAPAVAGTVLPTTAENEANIATQLAAGKEANFDRDDPTNCSAAAKQPPPQPPDSMPTRIVPEAPVDAPAANQPPPQPPAIPILDSRIPQALAAPMPVAAVAEGGVGAAATSVGSPSA